MFFRFFFACSWGPLHLNQLLLLTTNKLLVIRSGRVQSNVLASPAHSDDLDYARRTLSWRFSCLHLLFREFSRCFCPKRLTVIHTFIHWWRWLPCKVPTSTSGAVWGWVSCPRTLRHADPDQGNRTSDLPVTRCRLYPPSTSAVWENSVDVKLQKCSVDYETSPDSPSAWGWVDVDWIFHFSVNCSFSLRLPKNDMHPVDAGSCPANTGTACSSSSPASRLDGIGYFCTHSWIFMS